MKSVALCSIALLLLTFSCSTTDPPPPTGDPVLQFEAVDATCTEAWLEVKLAAWVQPRVLTVMRDTHTILTTTLLGSDTVIVDEGLIPNRQYVYKLTRPAGVFTEERLATATTMDTTSSEWVFQERVLGEVFSGLLYDVALVSDSLAYAVGSMYMRDSTGEPDLILYNLAIWAGVSWTVQRVSYQGAPPAIRSIFAFSDNDVWLDPWFHWNGQEYQEITINPILIGVGNNQMWGNRGTGGLYVVGNAGTIAYSPNRGTSWRREALPPQIPNTSNVYIADICGIPNSARVLALVRRNNQNGTYLIGKTSGSQWHWGLIYDGSHAQPMPRNDSLSGHYTSLYVPEGKAIYVATYLGVYRAPVWTRGEAKRLGSALPGTPFRLRGNGHNDIVAVGSNGMIAHFNGVRWTNLTNPGSGLQTMYSSVVIHGNLLIAVGDRNARGYAVVGRR